MKRILTITAVTALAVSPALADSHSSEESNMEATDSAEMSNGSSDTATGEMSTTFGGMEIQASNMIDHEVYIRGEASSDAEIPDTVVEPADNWESVGEIGDVIITKEGKIDSVIVDAGGFLGMGEKHVGTSLDELKFVASEGENQNGAFFIVFTGDRSVLEEREGTDRDALRETGYSFWSDDRSMDDARDGNMNTGDETSQQSGTDASGQDGSQVALSAEQRDALSAEDLQGLAVYGNTDERIGEISELIMSDGGEISQVVVDVGGFLGLGEKPVALPFEEISLRYDGEGMTDTLHATTEYTEGDFEGMNSWEG
jgi:sporulation protein YlmC with PRC-barrel domain